MRRAVIGVLAAALLAIPTVLAFFSGGFFDEPRLWAGAAAWALVLGAAAFAERPVPRGWPAWTALGGLALLTAWVGASVAWAPLKGAAFDDVQRLLLYLGAMVAAAALLRPRNAARWVEPVLCGGAFVVIGYGISERLLPGLLHFSNSASALGRLEQPLTYWNAMGVLAAMGLLLAMRLAGDRSRDPRVNALYSAAATPLGLGVYLSFSRGALFGLAIGTFMLVLLAPGRSQLRAIGMSLAATVLAALAANALPAIRGLGGGGLSTEAQGAVMLCVLVGVMGISAALTLRWCHRETSGRLSTAPIGLPRPGPVVAAVIVVAVVGLVLAAALTERSNRVGTPTVGAHAGRLGSFESNRYAYWKVALRSFGRDPLVGSGSGGFRVDWLRERPFRDPAQDAHSLYVETAGELGLVGLAALGLFLGGVAAAARRAYQRDPELTAGWIGVVCLWAVHTGLDWDWEMPAVSLIALILAGALLARADAPVVATSGPEG